MKSRVLSALLASVLAVTLAGCGNDDDPSSEETTSPSGEQSPDPDDESSPPEESASESPSVTPASGPLVENDAVSFHLFEHAGWIQVGNRSLVESWVLVFDEGEFQVFLTGSQSPHLDLDADAELVKEDMAIEDPPATRIENRVLNGVECWVFTGEEDLHVGYHIGGSNGGFQYELSFEFPPASQWPEGQQRLEEMLASVEWKFPTD